MVKIKISDVSVLNKSFNEFSRQILATKRSDTPRVISQLQRYEKQYNRLGTPELFCEKAGMLADNLDCYGFPDLAGMIYSNLMKIKSINPQMREFFMKKALHFAQKHGDTVHTLARIVDLKRLYLESENKYKYMGMLFQEERVLSDIVRNFGAAGSRFRTYTRGISSPDTYRFRLAAAQVDIAKRLLKSDPQSAYSRLVQAKNAFESIGRSKEARFAEVLIAQAKKGC